MQTTKIPLTQIRLEEQFRKEIEDLGLVLSIKRQGLKEPLTVEKDGESRYVLVEGYRRIIALKYLQTPDAECFIEESSSEEERVIKRLRTELQRKRKTGYELERMVSFLLNKGYDDKQIAMECDVTRQTIKKYMKGLDVNLNWKTRAEKTGAGRHGLTEINKLKNITQNNKEYVADLFIDRQISGIHVDSIKKLSEFKEFDQLPEESQKTCIDQTIEQTKFDKIKAKNIVYEENLKNQNSKHVHYHVFNLLIKTLDKIISICHKNFIDHLDVQQKNTLHKKIEKLAASSGMPFRWMPFPKETGKNQEEKRSMVVKIKRK